MFSWPPTLKLFRFLIRHPTERSNELMKGFSFLKQEVTMGGFLFIWTLWGTRVTLAWSRRYGLCDSASGWATNQENILKNPETKTTWGFRSHPALRYNNIFTLNLLQGRINVILNLCKSFTLILCICSGIQTSLCQCLAEIFYMDHMLQNSGVTFRPRLLFFF